MLWRFPRCHSRDLRLVAGGLAVKFLNAPLALAVSIFMARAMTVEGFGRYSYIISVILLAAMPAQVGLPTALVRYAAQYRTQGRTGALRGLIYWGRRVGLALSGLGMLGVVVWYSLDSNLTYGRWAVLLCIPLLGSAALRTGILRGVGWPLLGTIPEQFVRPVTQLALVGIVVVLSGGTLDEEIAVWTFVIGVAVSWAIGAYWLQARTQHFDCAPDRTERSDWMRTLVPLMVLGSANVLNQNMDVVLLQQFTAFEQVGLYKVALSSVTFVSFGLAAINTVVAPRFGELFFRGDMEQLNRLARLTVIGALTTALPIAVLFLFAPAALLGFLFGDSFQAAGPLLTILTFGHLANVIGGPCGAIMKMVGQERRATLIVLATSFANITGNVFVIPRYGAVGCAVVTAIAFAASNVWMYIEVRRTTGIRYIF